MNWIDNAIGVFSPVWKAARLRARAQIYAYEAAIPTRTHKARRETRTANQLVQFGGKSLREQARWLDCNHDLVIGILDKLEERIIGSEGINVQPIPLMKDGKLAKEFAKEIRRKWLKWSLEPEVTGQFPLPALERLMCRTWLRDGEVFAQMVKGSVMGLAPVAGVPFWLEALEPDFVPLNETSPGEKLTQGVYRNAWGRPTGYRVYKQLPGDGVAYGEQKTVPADRMLHLKFTRRLHQIRGNSMLAGVLIRLSAMKEYEDAELSAARIAAMLGMYIRKGDGQSYPSDMTKKNRELNIVPGMIFDDLEPGEDVGMIKSDRPNTNLEPFRNGQMRAVAAGTRGSYSSIARNYDGTYSAQRQELVESTDGYFVLQNEFISRVTGPVYRDWLRMAILSGAIIVPRGVDQDSLFDAIFTGPVMPWIDPVKEANAWKILLRGGAATESGWIRARGENPEDVKRLRKAEIDENRELGLVFDTDPANDKGGSASDTNDQKKQKDDDDQQSESCEHQRRW